MPDPIVTIFGGSGFVGRYVTQRMARAGWRVRVAVRRPNEAGFVRTYGFVGQVEPVQANVRDDASIHRALQGTRAVVNCVGILAEGGAQTFDAVVAEAPGRIARIAAEEGIGRFAHVSAIGADPASDSLYGAAKARGEAAVLAAFPSAVILRPSIMFGPEDQFFNRFAAMARLTPVLPLVGADTRFQPVYVDDVAAAVVRATLEPVPAGVYELGGPEVATFRELMRRMLAITRRQRMIVAIPFGLADWIGSASDFASRVSFGLIESPLTRDQVRQLRRDNVVAEGARGFAALGFAPTAMEAVLESYLYAFRPAGQYTEIQESAVRMR